MKKISQTLLLAFTIILSACSSNPSSSSGNVPASTTSLTEAQIKEAVKAIGDNLYRSMRDLPDKLESDVYLEGNIHELNEISSVTYNCPEGGTYSNKIVFANFANDLDVPNNSDYFYRSEDVDIIQYYNDCTLTSGLILDGELEMYDSVIELRADINSLLDYADTKVYGQISVSGVGVTDGLCGIDFELDYDDDNMDRIWTFSSGYFCSGEQNLNDLFVILSYI